MFSNKFDKLSYKFDKLPYKFDKLSDNFSKTFGLIDIIVLYILYNNHSIWMQLSSNIFQLKTLSISHLDQIYQLINENYITDEMNILRYSYGKDFMKWYLRIAHPELIIGLTCNERLVGMVIGSLIKINSYKSLIVKQPNESVCSINSSFEKIPYINFLCVHHKLRSHGLSKMLVKELELRLDKIGIRSFVFQTPTRSTEFSLLIQHTPNLVKIPDISHFVIPINYPKLKKLQFVTEEESPSEPPREELRIGATGRALASQELSSNPLHVIKPHDLDEVADRLNIFNKKTSFHINFDAEMSRLYLKPRKNICYAFANYKDAKPIDFINIYKYYYYVPKHNELIAVAQLGFYYMETMTLTELVTYLLDKLKSYGFDQLIFKQVSLNDTINITKFSTYDKTTYYMYNNSNQNITPSDIRFIPF